MELTLDLQELKICHLSKDWFARMEIRFLEGKNKIIVNGGFFVHIIKTV